MMTLADSPTFIGGIEIPGEWELKTFGDLFSIQQGKALSQKARTLAPKFPFLRTANVLWGAIDVGTVDEMHFTEAEREKFKLRAGDLLICEGGEIGRSAIWNGQFEPCYYQNHIHRCRPQCEGSVEFYMFWMLYAMKMRRAYAGHGNTTTIANMSKGRLAALPVPVPPVEEQRAIAHVLGRAQRAKKQTQQVISAATELRRRSLRETFRSKGWDVRLLGEVLNESGGSIQTGPFGSLLHAESYVADGIPFIMPADMTPDGQINLASVKRVTVQDHERLHRYQLALGDVLVGRRGEIGRRALVGKGDVPSLCGSGTLRIRTGETLEPRFLAALFELDEIREFLVSQAVGSTMLNLNSKVLGSLPIPLPSLSAQMEVADQVDAMARKVNAEEQRFIALDGLFKTLLHELMTGTRRVGTLEPV